MTILILAYALPAFFVLLVLTTHSCRLQPGVRVIYPCDGTMYMYYSFPLLLCAQQGTQVPLPSSSASEGPFRTPSLPYCFPFLETPSLLLFLPFCPASPALLVNLKCTKKSLPSFHFLCGSPKSDSISPRLRKLTCRVASY